MFYRGFKPGIILYRKIDDYIEVSEIEGIYPLKGCGKVCVLIPIIGNWNCECIEWYQSSKCFKAIVPFNRPNPHRDFYYYAGTDFGKVCGK